jgi:hypothetical protein
MRRTTENAKEIDAETSGGWQLAPTGVTDAGMSRRRARARLILEAPAVRVGCEASKAAFLAFGNCRATHTPQEQQRCEHDRAAKCTEGEDE